MQGKSRAHDMMPFFSMPKGPRETTQRGRRLEELKAK